MSTIQRYQQNLPSVFFLIEYQLILLSAVLLSLLYCLSVSKTCQASLSEYMFISESIMLCV